MVTRFNVSDVLERLDDDDIGLSSEEESRFEGEEAHGHLSAASQCVLLVAQNHNLLCSVALLKALMMMLFLGFLLGCSNVGMLKRSSSGKSYLSPRYIYIHT